MNSETPAGTAGQTPSRRIGYGAAKVPPLLSMVLPADSCRSANQPSMARDALVLIFCMRPERQGFQIVTVDQTSEMIFRSREPELADTASPEWLMVVLERSGPEMQYRDRCLRWRPMKVVHQMRSREQNGRFR